MLIESIMTREVITVSEDMLAEDAHEKIQQLGVHHLIVLKGAEVVGVLSDRDMGGKSGEMMYKGKTVGELTSKDLVSIAPYDSVEDAAKILRGYNIGCLPVIDEGQLVGIVTISDLLTLIAQGVYEESI